jgi:hypothetical protein
MVIEKEIIVNKNIESAWQVLGPQFAQVYLWASPVNHSEPKGEGFNGATCSERGCSTTMGRLKEKIIEYSDKEYLLKFHAYQGMPFVIKKGISTWKLDSLDNEKTRVKIRFDIELSGFMGVIMQPMMKMMMSKMGNTLLSDFKFYVENGRPSEAKMKTLK